MKRLMELGILVCVASAAAAHPTKDLSFAEKAARLKPGQYVWDSKAAPTGPLFLVIDLGSQRATLYRDGVLVAASTISTGSEGRETPTGVFTVLEKEVMHRSRTYDDAPMPYMQRLTWKGVAMHAGNLPGYPASHGCIRLPAGFAKLLFGVTQLGTPVMITDPEEIAREEAKATEYRLATEEFSRRRAELEAEAQVQLAEFDKAQAEHDEALRKHNAELAKYKSQIAEK